MKALNDNNPLIADCVVRMRAQKKANKEQKNNVSIDCNSKNEVSF
jgi:hypothetical protein